MVRSVPRRSVRCPLGALVLLLAGSVIAGCGDNRPFSRSNTAANATKLAVPSTLTPPVHVGRIDGVPRGWDMGPKIAEALRQRDIPAGTARQGKSAYELRGELRETKQTGKSTQISVVWRLYDDKGKKVGEVTQVAAVPKGAMNKSNEDVIEAIADAAAESISPIVPSTRIDVADNVTTGEPDDKTTNAVPKEKVTALGRQKKTDTGIARNFDAHVKGKDKKSDADKIALPRPLVPDAADKKAASAIGKIDDGRTALSRNLAKGLNPGAGDEKKTAGRKDAVDARPPDLTDRPDVAFKRRPKPAKLHRDAARKQVADAPDDKPKPKRSVPRPVVTEFYPALKPRRQAAAPKPKAATNRARAATIVNIPPKAAPSKAAPRTMARTGPARVPPAKSAPATKSAPPRQVAKAPSSAPAKVARTTGRYVYWVQVGSYRTPELSAAKWTETRDRAPSLLGTVAHRIARARVGDRGIWHRIQVGPYSSKGQALSKCSQLKAAKVDCFILPERAGANANPVSAAPAKPATLAGSRRGPKVTVVTNDTGRPRTGRPRTGAEHFPLATRPGLPGLIQ